MLNRNNVKFSFSCAHNFATEIIYSNDNIFEHHSMYACMLLGHGTFSSFVNCPLNYSFLLKSTVYITQNEFTVGNLVSRDNNR